MTNRICKICEKEKDINDFAKDPTCKLGHEHTCKLCRGERRKLVRREEKKVYRNSRWPTISEATQTATCEICGQTFYPTRPSNLICGECQDLVHHTRASLKSLARGADLIVICRKHRASVNCVYCSRSYTEVNYKTIDHIIPISKGGTHDPNNINICCWNCNQSKNNQLLNEWLEHCRSVVLNLDSRLPSSI